MGTASGLTLGLTVSVGGVLSPVFGLLADNWGVHSVLTTLIGILAVATLLASRLPEPGTVEQELPEQLEPQKV
jgi:FSR family fosmidomycin resistance protein-like MFS transporter